MDTRPINWRTECLKQLMIMNVTLHSLTCFVSCFQTLWAILFYRDNSDKYIISGHAATCHCSLASAGHWQWSKQNMLRGWCFSAKWNVSMTNFPNWLTNVHQVANGLVHPTLYTFFSTCGATSRTWVYIASQMVHKETMIHNPECCNQPQHYMTSVGENYT
jgi:hypothetical protein